MSKYAFPSYWPQTPVSGSPEFPSQKDPDMKTKELYFHMAELRVAEQPWGGLTCHRWAGDMEASACS